MDRFTVRLKLTETVGDKGLWDHIRNQQLHLMQGMAHDIELGLFDATGQHPLSASNLTSVTFEIYAKRTDAATMVTPLATTTFSTLTKDNWDNGTAQTATLRVPGELLNITLGTAVAKQAWGVIYGTFDNTEDGERRPLAAGPLIILRTNAGGTGPTETPDPLYPTNAQMAAILQELYASVGGDSKFSFDEETMQLVYKVEPGDASTWVYLQAAKRPA